MKADASAQSASRSAQGSRETVDGHGRHAGGQDVGRFSQRDPDRTAFVRL